MNKLKAKLLQVAGQMETSKQDLTLTGNAEQKFSVEELFGDLQGKVAYFEDLNRPALMEWEET